jgi:hypothetical protein
MVEQHRVFDLSEVREPLVKAQKMVEKVLQKMTGSMPAAEKKEWDCVAFLLNRIVKRLDVEFADVGQTQKNRASL